MGDLNTVCCMCGDVGFPDKLFRCARCLSRFQHSYCSNYYQDGSSEAARVCDWCRSEERSSASRHHEGTHSKKPPAGKESQAATPGRRLDYAGGERVKPSGEGDPEGSDGGRGKGLSGRPSGRRYKLLKDVMC